MIRDDRRALRVPGDRTFVGARCSASIGVEDHAVPPETIIYGNITDEESRLEAKGPLAARRLPTRGISPPRYRACDPVDEQRVGVVAGASLGQPSGADLSSTRSDVPAERGVVAAAWAASFANARASALEL